MLTQSKNDENLIFCISGHREKDGVQRQTAGMTAEEIGAKPKQVNVKGKGYHPRPCSSSRRACGFIAALH